MALVHWDKRKFDADSETVIGVVDTYMRTTNTATNKVMRRHTSGAANNFSVSQPVVHEVVARPGASTITKKVNTSLPLSLNVSADGPGSSAVVPSKRVRTLLPRTVPLALSESAMNTSPGNDPRSIDLTLSTEGAYPKSKAAKKRKSTNKENKKQKKSKKRHEPKL